MAAQIVVIEKERGNRGGEAGGGIDESLADAGSNGHDGGAAAGSDRRERSHDSPDSSEEADEWSGRRGGREEGEVSGETRLFDADGALKRALDGIEGSEFGRRRRAGMSHLRLNLRISGAEKAHQRRLPDVMSCGLDVGEAPALAEKIEKPPRRRESAPEPQTHDDDGGPGEDGKDQEDQEDCFSNQAAVLESLQNLHARL